MPPVGTSLPWVRFVYHECSIDLLLDRALLVDASAFQLLLYVLQPRRHHALDIGVVRHHTSLEYLVALLRSIAAPFVDPLVVGRVASVPAASDTRFRNGQILRRTLSWNTVL